MCNSDIASTTLVTPIDNWPLTLPHHPPEIGLRQAIAGPLGNPSLTQCPPLFVICQFQMCSATVMFVMFRLSLTKPERTSLTSHYGCLYYIYVLRQFPIKFVTITMNFIEWLAPDWYCANINIDLTYIWSYKLNIGVQWWSHRGLAVYMLVIS